MPRKVRVPASHAGNRQAQQRSRERRREYVASLEERLAEFERRGAQATAEMQNAAQAVAVKNEKLLALLALRGVKQHEIDAFLKDPNSATVKASGCKESGRDAPDATVLSFSSNSVVGDDRSLTAVYCPQEMHVSVGSEDVQDLACGELDATSTREFPGPGFGSRASAATVDDRLGSSKGPEDEQASTTIYGYGHDASSAELTSCDAAARILANLRGHEDVTDARTVLGCGSAIKCSVKNTHLFQLMDEAG